MSNFRERLKTLTMGLWVQPISRTRVTKCAFSVGCGRVFLHCSLFPHPKRVTEENASAEDVLLVIGGGARPWSRALLGAQQSWCCLNP